MPCLTASLIDSSAKAILLVFITVSLATNYPVCNIVQRFPGHCNVAVCCGKWRVVVPMAVPRSSVNSPVMLP
jgi:hypothetical protein